MFTLWSLTLAKKSWNSINNSRAQFPGLCYFLWLCINRKAGQISALSSGKIDKYDYLTGKEILPSNQEQIIEQASFTYSPLRKTFEKQRKTSEDQGKK